jgi:hypothetical protein
MKPIVAFSTHKYSVYNIVQLRVFGYFATINNVVAINIARPAALLAEIILKLIKLMLPMLF